MHRAVSKLARSGLRKNALANNDHLQHSLISDLPFSLPGALIRGLSTSTPSSPSPPSSPILEITNAQSFNAAVALSNTVPVILDAYAQWCGPCKQLDPVLKQQIAAQNGKIALAKLDIDVPAVAPLVEQLKIASVPTLILLFGGRAVDIKQGAPSPPELKEWIKKAIELAEAVKNAAGAKQEGLEDAASDESSAAAAMDPKILIEQAFSEARSPQGRSSVEKIAPKFAAAMNNSTADAATKAEATAGLALCAVLDGDVATAKELLSNAKAAFEQVQQQALPGETFITEIPAVEASLSLVEDLSNNTEPRSIQELQQAIESNKKDLEAMYALGLKLFEAGNMEEAVDTALLLVRRDREWQEQAGKKLVLKIADALGNKNEIGKAARRRLSNIWFI